MDSNRKKGLKINNTNSSIEAPKPPTSVEFEKKADAVFAKNEDYKQRMWDLGTKYRSLIENSILPQNKTLITKDFETEVLNKLIIVASEMNEDSVQPESIGATALCMLLMKMNLVQRDIINELAYKVDKLERLAHKKSETSDK